ncbi:uncharacterized protein CXorf65-like isoform X2 [Ranitomeya imitator]|uniref:uncharacterized protein CXorf65-like isoform X2 n=1 Tax=Ranitomeya imitator TaxID=111125 RepID=UPI0037E6F916
MQDVCTDLMHSWQPHLATPWRQNHVKPSSVNNKDCLLSNQRWHSTLQQSRWMLFVTFSLETRNAHNLRNTAEMFITVLYGESEETLFNINCKVQLLLESIKHLCHYENEGEIELADEGGQVKNLQENQQRYASELLGERETCVLLAVTRSPDSSDIIFTPLLNDDTVVNAKFLAKLGNWGESKDSSRKLKTKKSNRKGTVVISTSPEGKQSTSIRKRSVRS